ncbi:MAG: hypothetical protein AWT59_2927 [Candidatus Gallionella acididurans]|uniref:Type 4 fimbrial biogenesis protein PilX N-terminal domain-containing protein n=1 Tax=Candidatus Gallionella acididurans TaxID=1796491 RepID=A0A139BPT6_9PROT|nr:MAG: hypothetical protein AWT59_2927 [Candidatus Gallionella acididurans]
MKAPRSQSGFFLIIVVVTLMILAAILVPAMVALTGTSTSVVTMNHAGNMAFAAAESGLKYGVGQLESNYTSNPPTQPGSSSPLVLASPTILDVTPPCAVSVNITLPSCTGVQPLAYTVSSTAVCKLDSYIQSTRTLSIQVNATHTGHGNSKNCQGTYSFNTAPDSWLEN